MVAVVGKHDMSMQLWWVNPDGFVVSPAALALLSEAELAQHQRFIPPKKRHEYLVTRVMVRTVLGRALGVAPQSLQFVANEWGRPALWPTGPLHFNVSHTDGLVLCLVAHHSDIGVDTEPLARALELLELANTVFAPQELQDLTAVPAEHQAHRALVLWTLKESYVKARGMGMSLPLDGFAFRFDTERVHLEVSPELADDGDRWQFHTFFLGTHCISIAQAGMPRETLSDCQMNASVVSQAESLTDALPAASSGGVVVTPFCP